MLLCFTDFVISFQSVFAAQMGIMGFGFKSQDKMLSKIDQQSIARMKEIIAAQNTKRTYVSVP